LQANYDDGIVAYLNGREVARRGLPGGVGSFDLLADPHDGTRAELIDLSDYRALLLRGANLLAVEVHQATPDDPDLLWDAELVYGLGSVGPLEPVRMAVSLQSNGLLLEWSTVSGWLYQIQRSDDLVTWSDLGMAMPASGQVTYYLEPQPLPLPRRFYRILVAGHL
jgi:hypothetical protein